jgi:hypothetical protein
MCHSGQINILILFAKALLKESKTAIKQGYSCDIFVADNTMQQSIDRAVGIHGNKGTGLLLLLSKWRHIVSKHHSIVLNQLYCHQVLYK